MFLLKRIAGILVIAVLLLSCFGCSGPQASRAPERSTVSPQIPGSTQPSGTSGNPPSNPKELRFVVMADSRGSDNGVNSSTVKKTLERIKKLSPQPEFAVMPGDLVDGAKDLNGVKSQLEYFKKIATAYYPISFFYPGIGNHEVNVSGLGGEKAFAGAFKEFQAVFLKDFNRTAYFFDKGDARFFMLNSNHPGEAHTIGDSQLAWLRENIDKSKRYNFYFLHEPAYPTGTHVGSSLDANPYKRDRLWEVIDGSNSPMVFCGHEHNYTRRHISSHFNEKVNGVDFKFAKSVFQVTAGSFGAPLYKGYTSKKDVDVPPILQYHFVVVDINKDRIKATVYTLDGIVIDGFEQAG